MSKGELLFFKLFELYILSTAIWLSWQWAVQMPKDAGLPFPAGIAQWVDVHLVMNGEAGYLNALVISVLSICAFFRIQVRWVFGAILLLLHFQYIARFSLGKLTHSANFVGLALLAFAIGFIQFRNQKERLRFVLGFILFFMGLAYVSSAMSKLIGTGLTWCDGHHLWLWMAQKQVDFFSTFGILPVGGLQQIVMTNYGLASLFLLAGLVTELTGFLLWWQKTRPYSATAILALHIGIGLTLHIYFTGMALMVLLIGFRWPLLLDKAFQKKTPVRFYARLERLA